MTTVLTRHIVPDKEPRHFRNRQSISFLSLVERLHGLILFLGFETIYRMTVNLTSTASSDFQTTLETAAAAFRGEAETRPPAQAVVSALLQAEKTAKQNRVSYPLESLVGRWRLCFVVTTKKASKRAGIVLGRGFYVPKVAGAYISFSTQTQNQTENPKKAEISNQLQSGPFSLKLTGPAQFLGKKNLLAFDFTQMQICLFGKAIYKGNVRGGQAQAEDFYQQSIAKLPFFAFFMVTEKFIAARGRGGGLAIWIKES